MKKCVAYKCSHQIDDKKHFCDKHLLSLPDHLVKLDFKTPSAIKERVAEAARFLKEEEDKINPLRTGAVYFSHPVGYYKSVEEIVAVQLIEIEFPDHVVIDPSRVYGDQEFYSRLVYLSSAFVFLPYEDGKIGYGVANEIKRAQSVKLPIKKLFNMEISDFDEDTLDSLTLPKDQTMDRNQELKKTLPKAYK